MQDSRVVSDLCVNCCQTYPLYIPRVVCMHDEHMQFETLTFSLLLPALLPDVHYPVGP